MTSLAEILAAAAPPPIVYTFADLPGSPTLHLRPLTMDNPLVAIGHLGREAKGEQPPPATEADVEALRREDADFFAAVCVIRLEIDGQDRTADAIEFCRGLAVAAWWSRWMPLMVAAQPGQTKPEATPEKIAGE